MRFVMGAPARLRSDDTDARALLAEARVRVALSADRRTRGARAITGLSVVDGVVDLEGVEGSPTLDAAASVLIGHPGVRGIRVNGRDGANAHLGVPALAS